MTDHWLRSLRLWLRLQTGIRIGPRARLSGGRHRRGTRYRRLQHRLAVRLLALEQILDLVASQRFVFQQALGKGLEVAAPVSEDLGRLPVTLLDQTADLAVDLLHGCFGSVLRARHRHAQE